MKNKAILSIFLLFVMVLASSAVMAVKDIDITLDSITINGTGGDHLAVFSVQNVGDEVVEVSLSVVNEPVGPDGDVIDIENLNIMPSTISPGSSATGQFTAEDLDAHVMGQYIGQIRAEVVNGSDSDNLVIIVNVLDNGQSFVVTAPPQNLTKSDETVYQTIKVKNNANHGITVQVAKEGYEGMTFNADRLGSQTVAAFGTMNIVASVQVPADKAPGPYTATVNVSDAAKTETANLGINVQSTYKASVSDVSISDVDPGEQKSVSFSIQNKGNMALAGLSLSNFTLADDDGDNINLTFSPSQSINISVGSSVSVNAKADVSRKMDPGTYSQGATLSGGSISQTFTVNVKVNSILKITDIEVDPDELMPGEEFEVEVTVENVAEDIDMEDVEVEIYIMDGNDVLEDEDGDELEDDAEIGDLDEGDEEKVTFTFRIPYDAEDGDSYGVKVVVKGENADDSSEKYEDERVENDIIDVERPDHEVDIYRASLDSSVLSCIKTTYIEVGIRDIGADDEEVILTIKNDQLGIRIQDNFDMSSDYDDDEFEHEESYMLDFSSAPVGSYPVQIIADNEDDERLGSKTVTVTVQECDSAPAAAPITGTTTTGTTTEQKKEEVVVQYTSGAPEQSILGATVPAVTAAPVVSKAKKGTWADTPLGMAILVLANLLLLVLVVICVVYLASGSASRGRKKEKF